MDILLSSTSQGLLWSVMAIGVYLNFRILKITDLTAEGSFPLGAAIAATLIVNGVSPWIATTAALVSGMAAGMISALLHTKLKIPSLISGIITMTGLYSINLRIMGKANVNLLGERTLMETAESWGIESNLSTLLVGALIISLVIISLKLFYNTETGLAIRSAGDNPEMSEANGINTDKMEIISYMLCNGLIAMSGGLIAQDNGFADISSGIGTIVIALASIVIGEVIFRHLTFAKRLMTIVVGAVLYRLMLSLVLELNVDPQDLKVFSAILLTVALASPLVKLPNKRKKKLNQTNEKGASLI
ncbi:ABC transporter permease [Desemzia sp. C1]|uniref:ABC transporter permease n=1 Tax=Desemzia TaxID=82800 RepID=UPI0016613A96|nr:MULTISPECIES: ABC transporter permease [Desemzia]MCI3029249.1 ABC transporter permease [Desemzia sp. C1]